MLRLVSDRQAPQDEAVLFWFNYALTSLFHFCRRSAPCALDCRVILSSRNGNNRSSRGRQADRQIASDRVGPPPVNIDTRVQIAVVPASVPEILQNAPARVAEGELSALPTPVLPARIERKKANRKTARSPKNGRQSSGVSAFPFDLVNERFRRLADFAELHVVTKPF